jgi:hypothetical protein
MAVIGTVTIKFQEIEEVQDMIEQMATVIVELVRLKRLKNSGGTYTAEEQASAWSEAFKITDFFNKEEN